MRQFRWLARRASGIENLTRHGLGRGHTQRIKGEVRSRRK
jgi:hypothetical protein